LESGKLSDLSTMIMITTLAGAVRSLKGSLLILVDEYDQPVREALLKFLPSHSDGLYAIVKDQMKAVFLNYFNFFSAVKPIVQDGRNGKIWMTGITPVSIEVMSGLAVDDLTFDGKVSDAVGLRVEDVRGMLEIVHEQLPFDYDDEKERVFSAIQHHFNHFAFPNGNPLFHTASVNAAMQTLNETFAREAWLAGLSKCPQNVKRPKVESSIYSVLESARNLRPMINRLVEEGQLDDYTLNTTLTLEELLRKDIAPSDYLTLLVHVGVVSVTCPTPGKFLFKTTGNHHRVALLQPLQATLQLSLETLLLLDSKVAIYEQGEEILKEFVTSISSRSMAKLICWARSDSKNNILELQLQGAMVSEAHNILNGTASTTQENVLPATGKRTDITLSGDSCVIILELKQGSTRIGPSELEMGKHHIQLAAYGNTRRDMENSGNKNRPVAGFVVAMHNNGQSCVVEKLRGDL
jgi:hypothetical protein